MLVFKQEMVRVFVSRFLDYLSLQWIIKREEYLLSMDID